MIVNTCKPKRVRKESHIEKQKNKTMKQNNKNNNNNDKNNKKESEE